MNWVIHGLSASANDIGKLQYLHESEWVNLGDWIADEKGLIVINQTINPIVVDPILFISGETYTLRLKGSVLSSFNYIDIKMP
jgi:hypothetical protein